MRQQLIGYLFESLPPIERALLERRLLEEPALRRELAALQNQLLPLDIDCGTSIEPPADLTARTLDYVFAAADTEESSAITAGSLADSKSTEPTAYLSPAHEAPASNTNYNLIDMATAAGLLLAITLLLIPAVGKSRFVARVDECQNNLRQIGLALSNYSARHEGMFPQVPTQGPLAAAGVYAHTLVQTGYLENERVVLCPASPEAEKPDDFRLPSLPELAKAAKAQLALWRRTMGGSYGYTLGYVENGEYQPIRNLQRPRFAIMADTPLATTPANTAAQIRTDNHSGMGQNVLFEDGHVGFMCTRIVEGTADDIYANDQGLVAAGMHADDAVIAHSSAVPLISAGSRCDGSLSSEATQLDP
jgi:hypothetical protein